MSSVQQIVDNIAGNVGKLTDIVFKKRIENSVISARAEAIKRDYKKTGRFSSSLLQKIPCLKMIEVDPRECCDGSIDCKVYRTEEKIPIPIRGDNYVSITFVGTTNGLVSFGYVDRSTLRFIPKEDRQPRYTLLNDYIYTFFSSYGEISLEGVFNNLDFKLKDCKGNLCEPNMYIPEDLEYVVKQLVYEELRMYIPKNTEVQVNPTQQEMNQ